MHRGNTKITQLCSALASSLFSPNSFAVVSYYISFNPLLSWHTYRTTKHNLEMFCCFPESHFITFSLRGFELWNSLLFEEVKNKNGLRKYLKKLIERSIFHSDYSSLDSFYHSTSPHASIYYQEGLSFLLPFITGHCQWKGLKLDRHLHESVCLFLLFNYWKYDITNTVFNSQQ